MSIPELKRLFPFVITGDSCTRDQAAVLAFYATSDKCRVVGGLPVLDAEDAKRMLTVLELVSQGQSEVLEAKQRLEGAKGRVAEMDARLRGLRAQALELEERFDRELFALEREAVSLMNDEHQLMRDDLDPFSIRKSLVRPGKVKVIDGKTRMVLPDGSEFIESGRHVPWKTCLRSDAETALKKAQETVDMMTSPPAVLVNPAGEIELSKHRVLTLGEKILTLNGVGRIAITPGEPIVRYRRYSGHYNVTQIDIILTRALFYLAKKGILEKIK